MGFDPNVCEQKLKEANTLPVCPQAHCQDFQSTNVYHGACVNNNIYAPVQSMGCYNVATGEWYFTDPADIGLACLKKIQQDPNWQIKNCYCCCACFANDTPVATPDGQKQIASIVVGEQVLAGSVTDTGVSWSPTRVSFSEGTERGNEPAMVFLVYGDDNRLLVASPDQVFMLADGSLTTAAVLVPGQELRDADGNPVPVKTASLGPYVGGVHHIATETGKKWSGSIDGHLILAGGVVAGDYVLQLHFPEVPQAAKTAGHDGLPHIGTAKYAQTHGSVRRLGDTHIYARTDLPEEETPETSALFQAYTVKTQIPFGALSWITPAQADDILANGKQRPVTNRAGYTSAVQAAELLHGFYPDIHFYVDWGMNDPNVFAFHQYGEKFVVFSGGLARMDGFFYEGITMAMAHGAALFLGGEPQDARGMSCMGQADLYSFGVMSQKIWFGNAWIGQVFPAFQQINALFGFISKDNRGGNPRNACGDPGIDCRLGAMQSGMGGGNLPPCAGGATKPPVTLQAAQGDAAGVTLTFSQGITAETAQDPANYTITPAAAITGATRDPEREFVVTLSAELAPGDYHVDAKGLVSIYGTGLQPDPTGADFKVE